MNINNTLLNEEIDKHDIILYGLVRKKQLKDRHDV